MHCHLRTLVLFVFLGFNRGVIISVPVDTASPCLFYLQSSCAKTSLTACCSMMIDCWCFTDRTVCGWVLLCECYCVLLYILYCFFSFTYTVYLSVCMSPVYVYGPCCLILNNMNEWMGLFTLMLILCVCIVCLHFHCLLCVWQSFIK